MLVAVSVSNTSPTVASTTPSAAPAAKTKEQSSHSSSWRTPTIVFEAKSNYVGILFMDI